MFFPLLLLLFSVTVITVGIYSVIHSIASTVYILHCTEIKSNYHDPYPHICKHNLASSFFLSLFFFLLQIMCLVARTVYVSDSMLLHNIFSHRFCPFRIATHSARQADDVQTERRGGWRPVNRNIDDCSTNHSRRQIEGSLAFITDRGPGKRPGAKRFCPDTRRGIFSSTSFFFFSSFFFFIFSSSSQ